MTTEIKELLEDLTNLRSRQEMVAIEKQVLMDELIGPELKTAIENLEHEFAKQEEEVNAKIMITEANIKTQVLERGTSVRSGNLQAVYNKGRVTWDTKALDGYAAAHPEIEPFRKEGSPYIVIKTL